MPRVSVLMAVHNGMPHLPQAVESILSQTFEAFELLIVDDASTDESSAYLASLDDPRINLFRNKKNSGLSRSLNRGLDAATGEYVARMDHDDVSLPSRLADQVAFLDSHPEVDVCGAWVRTIDASPSQTWRYPLSHEDIHAEMLFASVLVHSTVMLRRASLEKHQLRYAPAISRAQDYDLWLRAAPHVRFANLGKVLLNYRLHSGQVGRRHAAEQQAVADNVRERQLNALDLQPSAQELALHHALARWDFSGPAGNLSEVESWLLKIEAANQSKSAYKVAALHRALEGRWWAACRTAVSGGLETWRAYSSSSLSVNSGRSPFQRLAFYAKCLLRQSGLRT